jgi:hypothetical protein
MICEHFIMLWHRIVTLVHLQPWLLLSCKVDMLIPRCQSQLLLSSKVDMLIPQCQSQLWHRILTLFRYLSTDEAAPLFVGVFFRAEARLARLLVGVWRPADVLHGGGTTAVAAAFASSSNEMRAVSTAAGQVSAARRWMICCCLAARPRARRHLRHGPPPPSLSVR